MDILSNISVRQCEASKAVAKTLNDMMKQPELTRYLANLASDGNSI